MGGHGRPHGAAASAGQGARLRAHSPPASARRWPSARAKPPPTYLTGKQEAALVAADDVSGLLLGAIGRRRRRGQPRQLGHRLQNRRASRCAAECAPGFVRHNLYDCRRQSRENSGQTDARILCMCVCRDLSHARAPKKSSARLWVSCMVAAAGAGAPDKSRQKIAFFRTVCISTLPAFALAHSACAVSPLIDKIDITVQTRGRTDFWNLPIGAWEYFVEVLLFTLKSRQEMPLHRSYCRRGVANSLSTSTARMGQRSVM